jgi:hypothetical protein
MVDSGTPLHKGEAAVLQENSDGPPWKPVACCGQGDLARRSWFTLWPVLRRRPRHPRRLLLGDAVVADGQAASRL